MVPADAWEAIRSSAALRTQLSEYLLSTFWPASEHDAITEFFSLTDSEYEAVQREVEQLAGEQVPFDPNDHNEGREYQLRSVATRKGQGPFRKKLLEAYKRQCAITGCPVEQVLEAAHIYPYQGRKTNHVTNGLLLRSDVHMLYDQGLIGVGLDHRVIISPKLKGTDYWELCGDEIALPDNESEWPSEHSLHDHLNRFDLTAEDVSE